MVRFTGVEIKDCPQAPRVSSLSIPLWKKSGLAFMKPRRRARAQKFCAVDSVHAKAESSSVSVPIWLASLCFWLHSGWRCVVVPSSQLALGARWERQRRTRRENDRSLLGQRTLLGSNYITLGLGRTRCSFKLTNHFPNPLWACAGPST